MNILIISPGFQPVPAFNGGAIEGLIQTYLESNVLNNIIVYSIIPAKKYNIDMIDPSKLYKHQIQYKIIDPKRNKEKSFMKCEIFFYRASLYFGLRNKDDNSNVLVFKKIDIKLIEANKDYNKDEGDNCVQLKVDDRNNEIIIIARRRTREKGG